MIIIMLPKECRIWLLAAQKPINKPSRRKGKFALSQMLALEAGVRGRCLFKGRLPTTGSQWQEVYRQKYE